MACDEIYATTDEYLQFWCVDATDEERTQVLPYLRRAAATINMSRQAQGACDCTLSTASLDYLRSLSIVIAAVYHNCPCASPGLSDEQRRLYLGQTRDELTAIRKGELELCEGQTGADFPALGWAEQAWTAETAAQIVVHALDRD